MNKKLGTSKLLIAVAILASVMLACTVSIPAFNIVGMPSQTPFPSVTPYPTNTPYPTYTLQPTYTSIPTVALSIPRTTTAYKSITWKELAAFLEKDTTNQNKYTVSGDYVCVEFSTDLVNNLHNAGYDAWIVGVMWSNDVLEGHAFVAVPTSDLGVVYIEPQDDARYIPPEVGKPLCRINDPNDCEAIDGIIYNIGSIINPAICDVNTNTCSGIIK
jgi:hypothetical protein